MKTVSDEQRFTQLYVRHHSDVDAFVRRRIHPDEVRDVVSEVFLVAWRRFSDVPDGRELPWLYGVARRTLANAYRTDQRRLGLAQLLAAQPHADVDDHSESVADKLDLVAAFDALGTSDQEVLRLSLWEALPARDAAQVLGCTTATYQVRLHRARKRLRGQMARVVTRPPAFEGASRRWAQQTTWGDSDA
ncbi:RNA polymerase sigma factor [Streptomyces sp. G5(2025)]|uniref:RNA polymerase sigma factor n=1 Tax=Streptomyces sp. G5(2025) TaxID=3406628 RepID=UPI003C160777